ncbi:MAG: endonuclease/exonuclease/phosphatase family protein [Dyadobacter sp.]
MKSILSLCCIFIAFSSFIQSKSEDPKKALRVMTYNIHHCNPPESAGGRIDVEAIAKVINNAKPDFVALQEVDINTERSGKGLNQAKQIADLTGMKFYFSKAIDHQGGDYGVAVLSKYPIVDSARFALPIKKDLVEEMRTIAAITVLLPSKQKIIFASTHLGLNEPNRLLQAETIMEHFGKEKLPMILAGDFNAEPESKVINYFDKYFTRSCTENCQHTIPVVNPEKTIDYIMSKPLGTFRVLSHKVIDEKYASDHLPVLAELILVK